MFGEPLHSLLPSGWSQWEMRMTPTRRIYFVGHNTYTTTYSDPRLPSTVDADAPHYKHDCRRKIIYFRSQQVMRLIADAKCDVRAPRKRLMVKFEGEDMLDYGGVSREWLFLLSHTNQASGMNAEHFDYFKFVDRVLGLPVFHDRFLDAYSVSGFYKTVLDKNHELELLIGGMTEITMGDRTWFTNYRGYDKTDRVIEWFLACLRSWPAERKAGLL
ncbi:hypothetical protein BJY52DRAFT_1209356 [Lactarius psammicola]|nr:hypothetical protein BJY52DRAFT_1209356 [Lactarius psammicola]